MCQGRGGLTLCRRADFARDLAFLNGVVTDTALEQVPNVGQPLGVMVLSTSTGFFTNAVSAFPTALGPLSEDVIPSLVKGFARRGNSIDPGLQVPPGKRLVRSLTMVMDEVLLAFVTFTRVRAQKAKAAAWHRTSPPDVRSFRRRGLEDRKPRSVLHWPSR